MSSIDNLAKLSVKELRALRSQSRATRAKPLLVKSKRERSIPLSYAQERLWFLEQMRLVGAAYNVPSALQLQGSLNLGALERALNELVARHESLRTRFEAIEGTALQVIDAPESFALKIEELSELGPAQQRARVTQRLREQRERVFDLATGPLFGALLLKLGPESHVLLLTMHHIVSDGWSMGVLTRELNALYGAYQRGEVPRLPALPIQYADYAIWQRGWLQGEVLQTQLDYWRDKLANVETLQLPMDRARPSVPSYAGAALSFRLSAEVTEKLKELSQREGVTLYMVLLAAFQTLLSRYSGQSDIAVGSPIAGRTHQELEGLIGFFVNTLVLRTDFSGDPSFVTLVARVKETTLGAYAHQDLPFEKLVADLQPERDLSRHPLCQVTFSFQNLPTETLELGQVSWRGLGTEQVTAKMDLSLYMQESAQGLRGSIEYTTDLFERSTIERLTQHFERLLSAIVAHPEARVSDYELLSEAQREQLLVQWNATRVSYAREQCLHEVLEAQASARPDVIALLSEDQQLTYRQLNERSTQLARYLRRLGVDAESIVAICMERSVDMVIGLLGIMKAGGAYLPLDPSLPRQRLGYMLEDAQVAVLLTHSSIEDQLPSYWGRVLTLDRAWEAIARESTQALPKTVSAQHLAYVIYTSGSTGTPKGVQLTHGGLSNLARATADDYGMQPHSRLLQFVNPVFDVSIGEIAAVVHAGATVCLFPATVTFDQLPRQVATHQIDTLMLPFSILAQFDERSFTGLKVLVVGGEVCSTQVADRWARQCRLFNAYGPTETTVCASHAEYRSANSACVPIGRPIANTHVYVLDEQLQAVPIGVSGELYIGGAGLARGYSNRGGLTAQKFIANPFSECGGERLYRTGDRVRWLADGNLEFLGRIDEQVKLRGYRIELGEIEAALLEHAGVKQAVVVMREDVSGKMELVGYVIGEAVRSGLELREWLSSRLPQYMLPTVVLTLKEFPRTRSGKVDRKAMPAPDVLQQLEHKYEAPRTATEEALVEIWSQLLKVERIGIRDNFFELGGHSLLVTRVVAQVREVLAVELPVRGLFEAPSIAQLAVEIEQLRRSSRGLTAPPLIAQPRPDRIPLSYSQERLWFLEQMGLVGAAYSMPSALQLRGDLDLNALERALRALVARHESLRTRFEVIEGTAVQVIDAAESFPWSVEDLSMLEPEERQRQLRACLQGQISRPFDLHNSSFRSTLLKVAPDLHVLQLTTHHIVSDGWSMGVLRRELNQLYTAYQRGETPNLPALPIQYADYAIWQRGWLQGAVLEQQLDYWRERLDGIEILQLPTDRSRPAVPSYAGGSLSFRFSAELTQQLRELSQREGVTLYMVLLAGFKALLQRYSGQTDIAIGTSIAGRTHAQVEGLIGLFLNALVLRTDLSGDPSFIEALRRVKEVTLGAYAHQDLPFEKLVAELQPQRDLSRQPLYQVMCVLQNFPYETVQLPQLSWRPMSAPHATSKLDLSLHFHEGTEGLVGQLEYAVDLFDAATVVRLLEHLQQVYAQIAADPARRISQWRLLDRESPAEDKPANTACSRPEIEQSCVERFATEVARHVERLAVSDERVHWTYRQLDEQANAIAWAIQQRCGSEAGRVGLLMSQEAAAVAGMIGVLKAGKSYVPLDPKLPPERLKYMAADARIECVITQSRWRALAGNCIDPRLIIELDTLQSCSNGPPTSRGKDAETYVLYTSGSTGLPKGVLQQDRNVLHFMAVYSDSLRITPDDRLTLLPSFAFDAAVMDIFAALLNGASLHVRDLLQSDPRQTQQWLEQHQITIWHSTPSAFRMLAKEIQSASQVRRVVLGGEAAVPSDVELMRQHVGEHCTLINGYGPTESTVTLQYVVEPGTAVSGERLPIGRPVTQTDIVLLSPGGEPTTLMGELAIRSEYVSLGYLNAREATARAFRSESDGKRVYRTGDRVRYRRDGTLEFLGRIDDQVKLRGYRIELGEIEAALQSHPDVRQAAVVVTEHRGERQLVAYCAFEGGAAGDLRAHLRRTLPEYMVPALLMPLDAMPLTVNGKIDRKALPAPQFGGEQEYEAPQGETEMILTQIWQQILKVERVGRRDNFFKLGGHSLLAIRVVARVREVLKTDLALRVLFEAPVVAELAHRIDMPRASQEEEEGYI